MYINIYITLNISKVKTTEYANNMIVFYIA